MYVHFFASDSLGINEQVIKLNSPNNLLENTVKKKINKSWGDVKNKLSLGKGRF